MANNSVRPKVELLASPTHWQGSSTSTQVLPYFTVDYASTPGDLHRFFRLMSETWLAGLTAAGMSKTAAAGFIDNLVKPAMQVAVNSAARKPEICGQVGALTLANARVLSSQMAGITDTSPAGKSLIANPVGWNTMAVATTTFAMAAAEESPDVMNGQGVVTLTQLCSGLRAKPVVYAREFYDCCVAIQTMYDGLELGHAKADVSRIFGPQFNDHLRMNGILGEFHGVVRAMGCGCMQLQPGQYRRDMRPVYSGTGAVVPEVANVFVATVGAVRAMIASVIEMAQALGMLTKESIPSLNGAPNGTLIKVRMGTLMHKLLLVVLNTRRYYNAAGPKDLAHVREDTGDARLTIHSEFWWRNVTVVGEEIHFRTSGLPNDIEGRARISDYNNTDATRGPDGVAPARPDSKKVKPPMLMYFAKNPQELLAVISASAAARYSAFPELHRAADLIHGPLRADTVRRLTELWGLVGGDQGAFAARLSEMYKNIENMAMASVAGHITRKVGLSLTNATASGARFVAMPRM